jgi:penicillin-binding protein 1A
MTAPSAAARPSPSSWPQPVPDPAQNYRRKAQELILAVWLELKFSKKQILALYLNRVYFGAGAYGIEAASQRYFNKPATRLTIGERPCWPA